MKNPKRNGKIAIEVTPLEATSTSLRDPHPRARTASFAAFYSEDRLGRTAEGLTGDIRMKEILGTVLKLQDLSYS